jgi:UDP-N-acetyl-D-mannosaminuronate dehydrogenase
MESKPIVGVVGFGEVGKAVASFFPGALIHDPEQGHCFPSAAESAAEIGVLHICFPCRDQAQFVKDALLAISLYAPYALVIVHSTVPVGTTEKIAKKHPHVVHSPVRGIHPNLVDGIRTFPKYVGADNAGAGRVAAEHLEAAGIHPVIVHRSATTELLKLLDTTYYGLAIAYHAYAERLCREVGVNFDMVMTEANKSYNEGYRALGRPNVVRPVLYPPKDGLIGGHCVVPNAALLRAQFGDDPVLEAILRHS